MDAFMFSIGEKWQIRRFLQLELVPSTSRSFVCLIVWACDKQSRSPGAEQSTEVGYVFYPWALMA